MRYVAALLVSLILIFGCTNTQPFAPAPQQPIEKPAPKVEEKPVLPSLHEGKGRFCLYDDKNEQMECNFVANISTDFSGIGPNIHFRAKRCNVFSLITSAVSPNEPEIFAVFPYEEGLIKIDSESTRQAYARSRLNPCEAPLAYDNGKLKSDYCFYKASTSELSCGKKVTMLSKGNLTNISISPTKINVCGMVGISGDTDNETYLAYIVRNYDYLFKHEENTSRMAVGDLFSDEECR
jgi:hypothetical protein